jgi:AcrR family transcriptional regulator
MRGNRPDVPPSCHSYEDTRIADIVELSGIGRPTFYECFEGEDQRFAAAYDDGVERLVAAVDRAVAGEGDWATRVSAGMSAGLDFLAADSPLAHLLLVEALAASRPARLEHERALARLAEALRPTATEPGGGSAVSLETARLLAGGLASHLSGRVLAGEAERLPESHDLLLGYLLGPLLKLRRALPVSVAPRTSE